MGETTSFRHHTEFEWVQFHGQYMDMERHAHHREELPVHYSVHRNLKMKTLLAILFLSISAFSQTSDAPTGRNHPLLLTVGTNAGAHGASTVFTAPATALYVVQWSLRTTTAGSAGTLTALNFAWNNGNAMSRNALLMGPQILDLASLVSVGLTGAEITGS